MHKVREFFFAGFAVVFFAGAAAAKDNVLLALNTPVKADIKITSELKQSATVQMRAGYTDFDAVSVNDPLYREGAKEMLKQVIKDDEAAQKKPVLRDAPISKDSKPARVIRKPRLQKPVHADPVKGKSTL